MFSTIKAKLIALNPRRLKLNLMLTVRKATDFLRSSCPGYRSAPPKSVN